MTHKAFTLIEVIIVVIIVGIIGTLGFPAYQNLIEDSKQKVCESNLKAINAALDIYAMEHDTIPADLSQIPEQYLQRAYASLLKQKGSWRIKLAYFVVGQQEKGLVYAGLFTDDLTRGTPNIRRCPATAAGTRSYGLNSAIKNLTSRQYRALAGSTVVAGDSTTAEFAGVNNLTARHRRYRFLASPEVFPIFITRDNTLERMIEGIIERLRAVSYGYYIHQ